MNRQLVALEDSDKEKDHILRVEWNIGKRCNYDCSYCNKDTHDDTSKFMEWDIYTNAIDQLLKFANGKPIKISFTGGEPFVHPKFIDMLK
jgi:MoaA/NifB/PqqE/SkfB family radical SAM enzyme